MSVDSRVINTSIPDVTAFRTYILQVQAAFLACGLVQTTDTGQIDPATVTIPGTTSTVAGYMIFRFNDALQATKPVHIKIEFRTNTSVATCSYTVNIGLAGTNGAGTLTVSPSTGALGLVNNNLAVAFQALASGDGSRFWQAFPAVSNYHGFFVDRTRDSNGVPTGDGVLVGFWLTGGSQLQYRLLTYAGAILTLTASGMTMDLVQHSTSGGGEIAVCPLIFPVAGKWFSVFGMNYKSSDFTALITTTLIIMSASHVFMPLGANAALSGGTGNTLALIYE